MPSAFPMRPERRSKSIRSGSPPFYTSKGRISFYFNQHWFNYLGEAGSKEIFCVHLPDYDRRIDGLNPGFVIHDDVSSKDWDKTLKLLSSHRYGKFGR